MRASRLRELGPVKSSLLFQSSRGHIHVLGYNKDFHPPVSGVSFVARQIVSNGSVLSESHDSQAILGHGFLEDILDGDGPMDRKMPVRRMLGLAVNYRLVISMADDEHLAILGLFG